MLGAVGRRRACVAVRPAPAVDPRLPPPRQHARRRSPAGRPAPEPSDLAALLRFEIGPLGGAPFGWSFLVAAALPLLIARAERHTWAVRGLDRRHRVLRRSRGRRSGAPSTSPLPPVDVLLVPAAAGLALATAMGVVAFEVDLPGYRFGWRQIASGLAAAAVVVVRRPGARRLLRRPLVDAVGRPRPRARLHRRRERRGAVPRAVDRRPRRPPARRVAARRRPRLRHHRRRARPPSRTCGWAPTRAAPASSATPSTWPAPARPPASAGCSRRWAIRYVVVPERLAPAPFSDEPIPVPGRAHRHPRRPARPRAARRARRGSPSTATRRPSRCGPSCPASVEVPTERRRRRRRSPSTCPAPPRCCPTRTGACAGPGPVEGDSTVLLSASSSDRWELEVDGEAVDQIKPFGWATGFEVGDGGDGHAAVPHAAGALRRAGDAGDRLAVAAAGARAPRFEAPAPTSRAGRRIAPAATPARAAEAS